MNLDKLFKKAKEKGIQDLQILQSNSTNLNVKIFEGEVDKYEIADSSSLTVKGIYNNKMGVYRTEVMDEKLFDEILDSIIASASYIDSLDDAIIYEGDDHYEEVEGLYNEELPKIDVTKKIDLVKEMDKKFHAYDKRVKNVEVTYSETTNSVLLQNSKGLKLSNKANSSYIYGDVLVTDGEDTRDGFDVIVTNKFEEYDIEKMVKEITDEAIKSLGSQPLPSKNYEIIFNENSLATLLSAFETVFSAISVQKGVSLLKDRLGEEVGSKLINIVDDPFMKNSSSSRSFDDEGVATKFKYIIKNGVLETFLHNLVTANNDNIKSTGNGFGAGISAVNLKVEAGETKFEDMVKSVKDGIYITSVEGAHAGANPVSGDFSLQATGYQIINGQMGKPVNLITIAGNFIKLLKNVIMVGDKAKITYFGITCPPIKIQSMPVSGK